MASSSTPPKGDECPPTPIMLDGKATPPPAAAGEVDDGGSRDRVKDDPDDEARSRPKEEEEEQEQEQETRGAGRSSSPEPHCSICLGELQNMSYTDSCFHKFCFTCLLEWSRVRPVCPLCKARFQAIIHTIKSDDNYESYELPPPPPPSRAQQGSLQLASFEAFMDREARFHYRTTMTRERLQQRHRELMERTG